MAEAAPGRSGLLYVGFGVAARVALLFGRYDDLIRPADLPLKIAFPALRAVARVVGIKTPA